MTQELNPCEVTQEAAATECLADIVGRYSTIDAAAIRDGVQNRRVATSTAVHAMLAFAHQSAQTSQPKCLADDVEAVARIVFPDAWEESAHHNRVYRNYSLPDAQEEARKIADAILAALAQPLPTVRGDDWQDIATAPKGDEPKEQNGPDVLIWQKGWTEGYEGFWYANAQSWYLANTDGEYGSPQYPTHWQHLPTPPADGDEV